MLRTHISDMTTHPMNLHENLLGRGFSFRASSIGLGLKAPKLSMNRLPHATIRQITTSPEMPKECHSAYSSQPLRAAKHSAAISLFGSEEQVLCS